MRYKSVAKNTRVVCLCRQTDWCDGQNEKQTKEQTHWWTDNAEVIPVSVCTSDLVQMSLINNYLLIFLVHYQQDFIQLCWSVFSSVHCNFIQTEWLLSGNSFLNLLTLTLSDLALMTLIYLFLYSNADCTAVFISLTISQCHWQTV